MNTATSVTEAIVVTEVSSLYQSSSIVLINIDQGLVHNESVGIIYPGLDFITQHLHLVVTN